MKANQPALGPRAIVPAKANDPLGDANPPGLLRTLVYGLDRIMFVQLPDEVLQVSNGQTTAANLTDGRKIPENTGPFCMDIQSANGSDTFVVQTVGLDSREWLDGWGNPLAMICASKNVGTAWTATI